MAKKYQFSVWKSPGPLWMLSHVLGGYFPNTQEKYLKILRLISSERCDYCSESLVYCKASLSYRRSKPIFYNLWLYYGMTYSFPVGDYWFLLRELGMISGFLTELFEHDLISDSYIPTTVSLESRSWTKTQDDVPNVPGQNNNLRICVQA